MLPLHITLCRYPLQFFEVMAERGIDVVEAVGVAVDRLAAAVERLFAANLQLSDVTARDIIDEFGWDLQGWAANVSATAFGTFVDGLENLSTSVQAVRTYTLSGTHTKHASHTHKAHTRKAQNPHTKHTTQTRKAHTHKAHT